MLKNKHHDWSVMGTAHAGGLTLQLGSFVMTEGESMYLAVKGFFRVLQDGRTCFVETKFLVSVLDGQVSQDSITGTQLKATGTLYLTYEIAATTPSMVRVLVSFPAFTLPENLEVVGEGEMEVLEYHL